MVTDQGSTGILRHLEIRLDVQKSIYLIPSPLFPLLLRYSSRIFHDPEYFFRFSPNSLDMDRMRESSAIFPKIVVDLVHRGHGFRSAAAMKKLCHHGIASACSAHVQKDDAMKHCYIPGKGNDGNASTREFDRIVEGPPRIELKLFEIENGQ